MARCLALLFLLVCCGMHANAQGDDRNSYIRFYARQISFEDAIAGFESRMGVVIQYDAMLVNSSKRFDLNYNNVRAKVAFADFLAQNGLTYVQSDQQIILKKFTIAHAKPKFVLSGRVVQKQSGEFLGNAEISVNNRQYVAYTSEAGYFSLFLNTDSNFIRVYYPGLDVALDTISADRNYFVNYELEMSNESMPEANIKISDVPPENTVQNGQTDQHYISKARIKRLPHLLGEPDIIRVMSLCWACTFAAVLPIKTWCCSMMYPCLTVTTSMVFSAFLMTMPSNLRPC
jgi:hypothetical protein